MEEAGQLKKAKEEDREEEELASEDGSRQRQHHRHRVLETAKLSSARLSSSAALTTPTTITTPAEEEAGSPMSAANPSDAIDTWTCPMCTLTNKTKEAQLCCSMCGCDRPSSQINGMTPTSKNGTKQAGRVLKTPATAGPLLANAGSRSGRSSTKIAEGTWWGSPSVPLPPRAAAETDDDGAVNQGMRGDFPSGGNNFGNTTAKSKELHHHLVAEEEGKNRSNIGVIGEKFSVANTNNNPSSPHSGESSGHGRGGDGGVAAPASSTVLDSVSAAPSGPTDTTCNSESGGGAGVGAPPPPPAAVHDVSPPQSIKAVVPAAGGPKEEESLEDKLRAFVSHKLMTLGDLDKAGMCALEALSKMAPSNKGGQSSAGAAGCAAAGGPGSSRRARPGRVPPPGLDAVPKFDGKNPAAITDVLNRYAACVRAALPGIKAEKVEHALLRDVVFVLEGAGLKFFTMIMDGRVAWKPTPPVSAGAVQPGGGGEGEGAPLCKPPTTWLQIVDAFHDHFLPAEGIARTASALLSLRQGPEESVQSLAERVVGLNHHLNWLVDKHGGRISVWEALQIGIFEQGLHRNLFRDQQAEPPCSTFQESVDRAARNATTAVSRQNGGWGAAAGPEEGLAPSGHHCQNEPQKGPLDAPTHHQQPACSPGAQVRSRKVSSDGIGSPITKNSVGPFSETVVPVKAAQATLQVVGGTPQPAMTATSNDGDGKMDGVPEGKECRSPQKKLQMSESHPGSINSPVGGGSARSFSRGRSQDVRKGAADQKRKSSRSPSAMRKPPFKRSRSKANNFRKRPFEWQEANGDSNRQRSQARHIPPPSNDGAELHCSDQPHHGSDQPPCTLPQCRSVNRQGHSSSICFYHPENGTRNRDLYGNWGKKRKGNVRSRQFREGGPPMAHGGRFNGMPREDNFGYQQQGPPFYY